MHLGKPNDRCYKETRGFPLCHLFDVPVPQVIRLSLGILLPILQSAPLSLLPHSHPSRMIKNLEQGKLFSEAAFPDCEQKTVGKCYNMSHQMINRFSSVLPCCFLTSFIIYVPCLTFQASNALLCCLKHNPNILNY